MISGMTVQRKRARQAASAGVWNYVRGFERLSLCDWPGRMSAVVYLGGCNLLCPTCHNKTLAWCHETLNNIHKNDLLAYLSNRARWLDGVTITGGEPTMVPGLAKLLRAIKEVGLPIKLDTNGMNPDVVQVLLDLDLVEQFAVDVKGPFAKYPKLTGNAVTADEAFSCLARVFRMARKNPERFYFRTTQVPCLTNPDLDVCRRYLPEGFDLTIQKYVEVA